MITSAQGFDRKVTIGCDGTVYRKLHPTKKKTVSFNVRREQFRAFQPTEKVLSENVNVSKG